MMATSKPRHHPVARRRTPAEKFKRNEADEIRTTTQQFDSVLTFHMDQNSPATNPPLVTDPPIVTNPEPKEEARNFDPRTKEGRDFYLKSAFPSSGLRFPNAKAHRNTILGRHQRDAQVAWTLCADMEHVNKKNVQDLVSNVFHEAAKMIQEGAMGTSMGQDATDVNGREVWAGFFRKLYVESSNKWPRRLSLERFTQFITALAEARWWAMQEPNPRGRQPGPLVHYISSFLSAADNSGVSWFNGGTVFYDADEVVDEDVDEDVDEEIEEHDLGMVEEEQDVEMEDV